MLCKGCLWRKITCDEAIDVPEVAEWPEWIDDVVTLDVSDLTDSVSESS